MPLSVREGNLVCGVTRATEISELSSQQLSEVWIELIRTISGERRRKLDDFEEAMFPIETIYKKVRHEALTRGYLDPKHPWYKNG